MKLRINRFIPETKVEGPGTRACVYVQGCPIRCEGCAVPETWDENGGESVDVEELADLILSNREIEGVTYLGGEPFAQAAPLSELGKLIKARGLSLVTFTGYELAEILDSGDSGKLNLLSLTDILIAGPFIKSKSDTGRPWVGSSNQKYHFLTDRYKNVENKLSNTGNKLEFRISGDGRVLVNGLVETKNLRKFISELVE
ncbi:MAG TPA: 4Fe-4S single cluster domain-containing protein [bacterium]|nr:4Fe-4S single cluster domain-containing protein [bacterium]